MTKLAASDASPTELALARKLVDTITDRARCALATQQQVVVGSVLTGFASEVDAHLSGRAEGDEPVWDERHVDKQPDWSYDAEYSGQFPADRFDEHRAPEPLPE
jgi:hypothetical protein